MKLTQTIDYTFNDFNNVKKLIKMVGMPVCIIILSKHGNNPIHARITIDKNITIRQLEKLIVEKIGRYNGEMNANYCFRFIRK